MTLPENFSTQEGGFQAFESMLFGVVAGDRALSFPGNSNRQPGSSDGDDQGKGVGDRNLASDRQSFPKESQPTEVGTRAGWGRGRRWLARRFRSFRH